MGSGPARTAVACGARKAALKAPESAVISLALAVLKGGIVFETPRKGEFWPVDVGKNARADESTP